MRTKLLIAAAGLVGLAAMPSAAQAQGWRGYGGWYPHYRHYYPYWAPFYRPRVYYVPPPVIYAPPPPEYYAPPVLRPAPVYLAPRVAYRSHVVHRAVRRPVQAAAACTCALPSAAQPAAVTPALPALRPAPAAPSNNLYPPERTQ